MANPKDKRARPRVPATPAPEPAVSVLDQLRDAEARGDIALHGDLPVSAASILNLGTVVQAVAKDVESRFRKLGGSSSLEILSRMTQSSLQDIQVNAGAAQLGTNMVSNTKSLGETLRDPEIAAVSDLFFAERSRIDDYATFEKIYEIVTFVKEAIQTYVDNIVSPDDMTKRDVGVFYEGADEAITEDLLAAVRKRCAKLISNYNLDDKAEKAIMQALVKGDYFMAVLNLRQELQLAIREDTIDVDAFSAAEPIRDKDVPKTDDADLRTLLRIAAHEATVERQAIEAAKAAVEGRKAPPPADVITEDTLAGNARAELAEYFSTLLEYNANAESPAMLAAAKAIEVSKDLEDNRWNRLKAAGEKKGDKRTMSERLGGVRGSVVKMIDPENVIKLYHDDVVFGYFFIEYASDVSDFGKKFSRDNTSIARSVDRQMLQGAQGASPGDIKERVIQKLFVKTLANKVGNADFITKNPHFAKDAFAILRRARQENRKVIVTYVAPDQMVHWTPDGAEGYGQSTMTGIKFLAKLYIGAMTNAFMRNSIRQPDKLVYYIDVGLDMDASNAVQNFIRTIKQKEVKFSNLKDITTTMRHVGEFHDLYIPTYNGERPVEIETINLSNQREVDSPFLEYLRKGMIAGMGVPAAFVGFSEEIAFARSLTMDNGRFLRRVIRHQKHTGRAYSRLLRLLYKNEYLDLEELVGDKKAAGLPGTDPLPDKKPKGPAVGVKAIGEAPDAEGQAVTTADAEDVEEIDPDLIIARFPSPATLNITNLADLSDATSRVAEFVTTTMMGDTTDPKARDEFRRLAVQDLMPGLDWEKFGKLKQKVESTQNAEKAKNPQPDAGFGGDQFGGDQFGGLGGEPAGAAPRAPFGGGPPKPAGPKKPPGAPGSPAGGPA